VTEFPTTYAVPVEAVSHGADFTGKLLFTDLHANRMELRPLASVEKVPDGRWVATIFYVSPGTPRRAFSAHVALLWADPNLGAKGS
jgi:hypothetical protein